MKKKGISVAGFFVVIACFGIAGAAAGILYVINRDIPTFIGIMFGGAAGLGLGIGFAILADAIVRALKE